MFLFQRVFMNYNLIIFFIWWLGLFLFGLNIFEESIKNISGKKFKNLLKKYTNTNFKAILSGTFTTTILQSSSVVGLILLAFVGAGFIPLQNAIWVIIWTNIWSALADIILGWIWLKFDTRIISMVLVWISWIFLIIFNNKNLLKNIFKLTFGLWLLFLWLSFIKDNLVTISWSFDFQNYNYLWNLFYFGIWLALTALMQSSSAMIIIVLALAGVWMIDINIWISIVMWAYLWTTSTAVIWSIWWKQIKKQVAFFNVFFNLILVIVWFLFFDYIVYFFNNILWLKNNLIFGLSLFVVWFKIFGAILIFPFIWFFTFLIKKLIPDKETKYGLDIEKIEDVDLDISIGAIRNDIVRLIKRVFKYNVNILGVDEQKILEKNFELINVLEYKKKFDILYLDRNYSEIKAIEEKIIKYTLDIKYKLDENKQDIINNIYNIISNTVYSAKYIKDIQLNIDSIQDSDNRFILKKYDDFKRIIVSLYKNISQIIDWEENEEIFNQIIDCVEYIKLNDSKFLFSIGKDSLSEKMDEFELSWLINVNRYIYLSCVSIISSVKELFLDDKEKKFLQDKLNF